MEDQRKREPDTKTLLEAAQGGLPQWGAFVLLPVLCFRESVVSLRLKIGEGKLSFIRDIPSFLMAMGRNETYPVSRGFTFSPSWMRLNPQAQALADLLIAYVQALEAGGRALAQTERAKLPLTEGMLPLLLKLLEGMTFRIDTEEQAITQQGINTEALPLLFRAAYDLRGVLLHVAWQAKCVKLTADGRYALMRRRVVSLSPDDQALILALPPRETGSEFTYRFNREETPRVFSELLPWLQGSQAVVFEAELEERLLRVPLKTKVYLDRAGDSVTARVAFIYGEQEADPFLPEDTLPAYLFRDAAGERQVMDLLAQYGFRVKTGQAYLTDPDLIFEFLMKGVQELHRLAQVYLSHAFHQLTPRAPRLSGHIRLSAGSIHFELQDGDTRIDDLIPLMLALKQRKKYFRYKNGTFVTLADAREWQAVAEAILENETDTGTARDIQMMRAHYLAALIDRDSLPVTCDQGAEAMLALDPQEAESPVENLYDYQLRGFRWITALHMLGLGGILADEMGLGKTAQMIAAILYAAKSEPARLPSLIVSPTTLMYNWQAEIIRFAPQLSCAVITGSRAVRERELAQALESGAEIIITSYPLLRQDIALYENIRFRYAALDEAQNIKNFTSQSARAAKRLNAHTRLALTGTPMENNVSELWSLFDFVLPGYLPNAREFIKTYAQGQHAADLRMRIRPFLMRRLKKDVMSQLPAKYETTLYAQLGAAQRRVYDAALLQSRSKVQYLLVDKGLSGSRIEVLAAIMLLRQICCDPSLVLPEYAGESAKLELLMDVLPEALQNGRRVLVFSQFTSMLKIIRQRLLKTGIPSLYLDGETPAQERVSLAERFNQGEDPVFLISLKAGGTGLNLTGADMVIHFDPWWNPTAEDQANDRAHRLGQEKPVQIIHLITLRSIEEAVVEMGRRKRRLFDRLITPGEAMPQTLSREDILKLFEK